MSIGNRFLEALPPREFGLVSPHLRKTLLPKNAVLSKDGQRVERLYFPISGLISCMASTSAGQRMEIYSGGHNDVLNVPGMLNENAWLQAKVQFPGVAFTLAADEFFRLIEVTRVLPRLLFRYLQILFERFARTAVCARFHGTEQRVSLWLALAAENIKGSELECTHESIAEAVGARRATVTTALSTLEQKKVIHRRRGILTILSMEYLESFTCDCLHAIRAGYHAAGMAMS